jgi:heterotetrameric sarcosine oxidase gamma subunit
VRELAISRVFDGLCSVGSGDGVGATERVNLGITNVMLRRGKSSELAQVVKQHYGVELVDAPVRCKADRISFMGTGSGRWLAVFDNPSDNVTEDLQRNLEGVASVIDQSHAFGILRMSGPALLSTLEKGAQIDLAPDVFKVGHVAATNISHIGIYLWKIDEAPTFDIAVARSLAGSFSHWLESSAAIHGLVVHRRPL